MKIAPIKLTVAIAMLFVAVVVTALFFWFEHYRSNDFAGVAVERAKLIDGIESYWSVSELERFLLAKSLSWKTTHGPPFDPRDMRPPFVVVTVTVESYSHLGYQGELEIEFFNDRLVGARFFPQQVDVYVSRLSNELGIDLVNHREVRIQEHTRVWIAELGVQRKRYVGWEDLRLSEEISAWIRKYS